MLPHGFVAAVANQYFAEKSTVKVKPVGSMQLIIQKHLQPGDGYVVKDGQNIDITTLKKAASNDPEGEMNYIQVSALARIYNEMIRSL